MLATTDRTAAIGRILPVPARSGGGRLTKPTPAVPPPPRERVFVPGNHLAAPSAATVPRSKPVLHAGATRRSPSPVAQGPSGDARQKDQCFQRSRMSRRRRLFPSLCGSWFPVTQRRMSPTCRYEKGQKGSVLRGGRLLATDLFGRYSRPIWISQKWEEFHDAKILGHFLNTRSQRPSWSHGYRSCTHLSTSDREQRGSLRATT